MRILVTSRPTATAAERADAVRSVNGWVETTIPALGITRIALPGGADDAFGDGAAVAAVLAAHPAVARAELDSSVRLLFDPNDQYYRTSPFNSDGQWGIRRALIDKAWDVVRAAPTVIVATLDTGIDPGHPDLQGVTVPGATFVSQPSSECEDSVTRDDNSHGTHVAGIVAANANNGIGVAGVAFGAKVMPLKVLDCTGVGSLSDVAAAIVHAVDHGARIVNLSLGSPFDSTTLRAAVTYAASKNVLVVTAAGNCGTFGDRCTSVDQVEYPAAYPEVISVGATDTDDTVAFFSTRNETVDVSAPGRRIVSTTPTYPTYLSRRATNPATQLYAAFSGTSQASPFVAGLAALIWSAEPSLTASQVHERIRSTVDDLGSPGRDDGFGYGRINALRAVTLTSERFGATYDASALPGSAAAGRAFTARVSATNTSSFTWRAADPGAVRLRWSWLGPSAQLVPGLTGTLPLAADIAPAASGTLTGAVVAPSLAGTYTLRLDLERGGTTLFSTKGVAPSATVVTVGSGFGAAYAPPAGASSVDAGASTQIAVTVTNTGTETWPAGGTAPVRLSYHLLRSGAVVQWDGLRAPLAADVPPGGKATLAMPVLAPSVPGQYTLRLDLVREGVAWFSGLGVTPQDVLVNVRAGYVAAYGLSPVPILFPGGRTNVPVTISNTGTATWDSAGATPVRVASHLTDTKGNVVVWDGARAPFAADVPPGAQVTVAVVVDAPATAGAYRVRVDIVREGVAWFSALGVATADTDLLVVADVRAAFPSGPISVSRADPVAQIAVKNTGVAMWTPAGADPIDVGVHWYDAAGRVLLWDGPRTPLPAAVASGESVAMTVRLGPPPPGAALVAIDLVSEGIAWFGQGPPRLVTFVP